MNVKFHKKFSKQFGKQSSKIQKAFQKRLEVFMANPFDPILSNHSLTGEWEGQRSIDISGDIRAIYELVDEDIAYFQAIGTHSQLYR